MVGQCFLDGFEGAMFRLFPRCGKAHLGTRKKMIGYDKNAPLMKLRDFSFEYHNATNAGLGENERVEELIANYCRRRPATTETREILRRDQRKP